MNSDKSRHPSRVLQNMIDWDCTGREKEEADEKEKRR